MLGLPKGEFKVQIGWYKFEAGGPTGGHASETSLVRSNSGKIGKFLVFADDGNQGLGGAGEAAISAVDEAEFAPEVDAFDVEQLYFPGFDLVARKALTDKRDAGIRGDEALDHANAGQLHDNAKACAIGTKQLVEHLASVASTRKNERLAGNFLESDLGAMRQRIATADHEAQTITRDVMNLESRRFDGERYDAHIDGTILDALQNLVAEISVNADAHLGITALKFRKNVRK